MRKTERGLMSAFQKLIRLQPGPHIRELYWPETKKSN